MPPEPKAEGEMEHFPKAPIVEALLDIRVELPHSVTQEVLAGYGQRIVQQYPTREVRKTFTGQFEIGAKGDPVARTHLAPAGYLYRSRDGLRVVQARKDGFSFSRLRPYTSWGAVSEEALSLWKDFVALTKPTKVTRLGLRYINRIEIPRGNLELGDYFLTRPEYPVELPQAVEGFLLRLALRDHESQALAIVTLAVDDRASTTKTAAIIFDIDVSKDVGLPVSGLDVMKHLAPLRNLKNRVFELSLTEKTKEMFR